MKKFLLFDFDGVILDSYRPAFAVHQIRCPHLTEDEFKHKFEGNINDFDTYALAHTDACRLDMNFFEHYVPRMEAAAVLVPGMDAVVKECAQRYMLVIISSTITLPIQKMLGRYGLDGYFAEVMGNDVHRSKVEKIKMVFAKYGVGAGDCLFITDTLGDMAEAEKTGVSTVGVTWGYHTPETLQRGKPFRLVTTPQELSSAIGEYFTVAR